jgi:coenzyme F420-0:L-glutamate ligase/coenzyme F420-1:gamma-L-glutamate ligase
VGTLNKNMPKTELIALDHFPLVNPGDDLCALILACCKKNQVSLQQGDVLVLAQKIVSKAENRYVDLKTITPSTQAKELADKTGKDARAMEVLLGESKEVLKTRTNVVIVEHNNGYVHANAGIDHSNIQQVDGKELLLMLPKNPDQSARKLREQIRQQHGTDVNVIINDSFGRPFRNGVCGVCIGSAGFEVIDNKIGHRDLFGNILQITEIAIADEIAAAASLVMGQADEGQPVVIVRGLNLKVSDNGSQSLLRKKSDDLFRQ